MWVLRNRPLRHLASDVHTIVLRTLSVALLSAASGCATQINSSSQPVLFLSEPPGAQVWVDHRFSVMTPGIVRLSRLSSHHARVEKAGYQPVVLELDRGMSLWTLMDIVCLPLVVKCILDDRRDGGFYTLDDEVIVTLNPLTEGSDGTRSTSAVESSQAIPATPTTQPGDRSIAPLSDAEAAPADPLLDAETQPGTP